MDYRNYGSPSSSFAARWLSGLLASFSVAERDAFWCGYLHLSYKDNGIVKRLIDASRDIDLRKIDHNVSSRWALLLLWFTAAADRRVKDEATRAATAIFRAQPDLIPPLVERFLEIDDQEVCERLLLTSYGALLVARDTSVLLQQLQDLKHLHHS